MIRNDDLVHENLAGYRITGKYSSTVFSTTFVGESISPTATSQRVLIKMLSTAGAHTQQEREEILQKIAFLQKMHHPHILPILATGMHEGTPYIITEYLTLESLHDRLQRRTMGQPTEMEEALLILAQVGLTLQYAHQQQVIHGYLKPQSVLFNMQDEVLVTGFHRHILQLPEEAEDTSPLELSIYRAPEQITGQASEKSDQYALGCIAYEMFTGYKAFMIPSVNMPGTFYKTRSLIAPGRLNPALPSYIEEAILKAMCKVPEQRYRDIAAFLAALKIAPDMKKTALLPQITLGEVSDAAMVKKRIEEKHAILDVLARLLPDTIEHVETAIPASSVLLDVSSGYLSSEDEITFKIHMPHGVTVKPPLRIIREWSGAPSRRTLIIIICLLASIILFAMIMVALNFAMSSKKSGTSPTVYGTSVVYSSIPTHVPVPVATRPGSSASTPGTIASSQGQGVPLNQTPTPGSGGFLQGVSSISSSRAQFWFAPNGWTVSGIALHYTGTGQAQQNVQMFYNSNAGQWEYMVSGLSPAQTIIYWFSYQQGGMEYTSGTYTYTVSASAPTPVPQPTPTSVSCADSYSEGVSSVNASQGLFWFSSCGWTATYVIVHYTGTGQAQQNLYMSYSGGAGHWQYTASGLNGTQTITYWFTYMQNGTQHDSAIYTWVHPGK